MNSGMKHFSLLVSFLFSAFSISALKYIIKFVINGVNYLEYRRESGKRTMYNGAKKSGELCCLMLYSVLFFHWSTPKLQFWLSLLSTLFIASVQNNPNYRAGYCSREVAWFREEKGRGLEVLFSLITPPSTSRYTGSWV